MILVKTKLKKSSLHGVGIFADEFIPKGTRVWEFCPFFDLVLTKQQLNQLSVPARAQVLHYAYISKKTGRYVLCSDDSRFFNHQAPPNVICQVPEGSDSDEALVCFACKDIFPGEELTNDYAEFDADPDITDSDKPR